jgi:hypothetical protein
MPEFILNFAPPNFKHMKNWKYLMLMAVLTCGLHSAGLGQEKDAILEENKALLREMIAEDASVVDALVMYPEETLIAILETCAYPELLVRADGMQAKSQAAFQDLIKKYDRDQQEEIYDLVRYDGLIKSLVEGGVKSKDEIKVILKDYPDEIHETALKYTKDKKYAAIKDVYDMNNTIAEAVENVLSRYPEETQDAIVELFGMPEVMTLLIDNMNFTVILSDLYKSDPDWVLTKAAERQKVLASENAAELAEYEESLKKDPEAYSEMLALAEQYARDNGVQETYKEPIQQTQVNVVTYSYPYWYGYPYWYTTPYWRPVPWYYHTGFYFGPGGVAIRIGFPSGFYIGWHHHYYPNRYHHLSSHYCRHYYSHPYSRNNFYGDINIHVNNNKNVNINRNEIKKEYRDLWEGSKNYDRNELQQKLKNGEINADAAAKRMEDRGLDATALRDQAKSADINREQLSNRAQQAKDAGVTKQDVQNRINDSGKTRDNIQNRPQTSDMQNKIKDVNRQDIQDRANQAGGTRDVQNRPQTSDLQNKIQQSYNKSNKSTQQRAQDAVRNNNNAAQQRSKNSYNNYKGQSQHNNSWNKGSGSQRPGNNNSYTRPSNSNRPSGGSGNYNRPTTTPKQNYSRPTGGGSSYSRPSNMSRPSGSGGVKRR